MDSHAQILHWIDSQQERMLRLVWDWAAINSGTHNLAGLGAIAKVLAEEFAALGGEWRMLDLPPLEDIDSQGNAVLIPLGQAISIRKRPGAPLRIFLGIHMDTVYDAQDPFQQVTRLDDRILCGPGVVDAKGGLAVMLVALQALERSESASHIGWEVLINPDEEIGSPGSAKLLAECAARNHLGLVFEPVFPDGSLVSERKGSGNFSIVIRGRAAHAGRDFQLGRNAIVAAADFAMQANAINGAIPQATVNVGRIDGGGAVNVVPDLGIVRLNVRVGQVADQELIESKLRSIASGVAGQHEVTVEVHGGFLSPPKVLDSATQQLCRQIEACGDALGIPIRWRSSGGVSDGNKLAAAGLAVIDTMGPRGGNLHSPQEYLEIDSLTERAKLCALLLAGYANGEFPRPAAGAL
jgi:glutamate carboxypeptidase